MFNSNMGCIEISKAIPVETKEVSLTVTWDVLKFRNAKKTFN